MLKLLRGNRGTYFFQPFARVPWVVKERRVSFCAAEVGVDPKLMGIGPAFAIPPALEKVPNDVFMVKVCNQMRLLTNKHVGFRSTEFQICTRAIF